LSELQHDVSSILERLNQEPRLALAALVNPLLALEELGYDIAPGIRPSLEHRMRFPPQAFHQLECLQREVFTAAGHPFTIDEPRELYRVLFDELRLPQPDHRSSCSERGSERALPPPALVTEPLPPHVFGRQPVEDPLGALAGAHPIMRPLLEYRLLESSEPRFAPRPLYDGVKNENRAHFVTRTHIRLKQAKPKGDAPPADAATR
jgi:hypothetical protein